jgi:large subunit ribosomal protein L22
MKAHLRHIRMTQRKINLVAGLIRGMRADDALEMLDHINKKATVFLKKVLNSAIHNAIHNDKKKREDLFIDAVVVSEGKTLKRGQPISRGRYHRILKRSAHLSIQLR